MRTAHITHLESIFISATMAEGREFRWPKGWLGRLRGRLAEGFVRVAFAEAGVPWD